MREWISVKDRMPSREGLQDDESEYVRKSIGNALKDISKKYPELVSNELKQWDLSSKEIKQVHKLASAYLNKS